MASIAGMLHDYVLDSLMDGKSAQVLHQELTSTSVDYFINIRKAAKSISAQ